MKKSTIITLVVVGLVIIVFFILGPFFVLEEGQQALIVRFGRVERVVTDAGLHLKVPTVDNVIVYSKRLLTWDGNPQRIQTRESQYIIVDTTARWRITDLQTFYESNPTMEEAFNNLDSVIDSAVRTVIANNNLIEAVRNTNSIFSVDRSYLDQTTNTSITSEELDAQSAMEESILSELSDDGLITEVSEEATESTSLMEEDLSFQEVERGRRQLSQEMLRQAQILAPEYGIEIIDVVIRQIKYSDDLTESVYRRMISERNQQAQRLRSFGEGRKLFWFGQRDRDLQRIRSEAYRDAEIIRGTADAVAADTYANAYELDPDFFQFWRAIESYRDILPQFNSTLTTDLDYFNYLYSPTGD